MSRQGFCYTVLLILQTHSLSCHWPCAQHILRYRKANHPTTILSKDNILTVEGLACQLVIPERIGQVPSTISTHLDGFTADQWRSWQLPSTISTHLDGFSADQWRSWIAIYSAVCLWNILRKEHWDCWDLFLKAVKAVISCCSIKSSCRGWFLISCILCKISEVLWWKEFTTNMHLHLHLIQSVHDYRPTNAFTHYAFERKGAMGF